MNILLNGASGKVGRCIEALAADDAGIAVVARGTRQQRLPDDVDADVVIDFSRPDAMQQALEIALALGTPFVSGTTGLEDHQRAALEQASTEIPICYAANFAVGVHVLDRLVRDAGKLLGDEFDIELIESHHRAKIDAPSGTALQLARTAAVARGMDPDDAVVTDGHRGAGARSPERIGIQSVRGGDVVGEHTVLFLGDGERLELVHRATDRSLFARGALRAARWLIGRPPGLFGLDQVIERPAVE